MKSSESPNSVVVGNVFAFGILPIWDDHGSLTEPIDSALPLFRNELYEAFYGKMMRRVQFDHYGLLVHSPDCWILSYLRSSSTKDGRKDYPWVVAIEVRGVPMEQIILPIVALIDQLNVDFLSLSDRIQKTVERIGAADEVIRPFLDEAFEIQNRAIVVVRELLNSAKLQTPNQGQWGDLYKSQLWNLTIAESISVIASEVVARQNRILRFFAAVYNSTAVLVRLEEGTSLSLDDRLKLCCFLAHFSHSGVQVRVFMRRDELGMPVLIGNASSKDLQTGFFAPRESIERRVVPIRMLIDEFAGIQGTVSEAADSILHAAQPLKWRYVRRIPTFRQVWGTLLPWPLNRENLQLGITALIVICLLLIAFMISSWKPSHLRTVEIIETPVLEDVDRSLDRFGRYVQAYDLWYGNVVERLYDSNVQSRWASDSAIYTGIVVPFNRLVVSGRSADPLELAAYVQLNRGEFDRVKTISPDELSNSLPTSYGVVFSQPSIAEWIDDLEFVRLQAEQVLFDPASPWRGNISRSIAFCGDWQLNGTAEELQARLDAVSPASTDLGGQIDSIILTLDDLNRFSQDWASVETGASKRSASGSSMLMAFDAFARQYAGGAATVHVANSRLTELQLVESKLEFARVNFWMDEHFDRTLYVADHPSTVSGDLQLSDFEDWCKDLDAYLRLPLDADPRRGQQEIWDRTYAELVALIDSQVDQGIRDIEKWGELKVDLETWLASRMELQKTAPLVKNELKLEKQTNELSQELALLRMRASEHLGDPADWLAKTLRIVAPSPNEQLNEAIRLRREMLLGDITVEELNSDLARYGQLRADVVRVNRLAGLWEKLESENMERLLFEQNAQYSELFAMTRVTIERAQDSALSKGLDLYLGKERKELPNWQAKQLTINWEGITNAYDEWLTNIANGLNEFMLIEADLVGGFQPGDVREDGTRVSKSTFLLKSHPFQREVLLRPFWQALFDRVTMLDRIRLDPIPGDLLSIIEPQTESRVKAHVPDPGTIFTAWSSLSDVKWPEEVPTEQRMSFDLQIASAVNGLLDGDWGRAHSNRLPHVRESVRAGLIARWYVHLRSCRNEGDLQSAASQAAAFGVLPNQVPDWLTYDLWLLRVQSYLRDTSDDRLLYSQIRIWSDDLERLRNLPNLSLEVKSRISAVRRGLTKVKPVVSEQIGPMVSPLAQWIEQRINESGDDRKLTLDFRAYDDSKGLEEGQSAIITLHFIRVDPPDQPSAYLMTTEVTLELVEAILARTEKEDIRQLILDALATSGSSTTVRSLWGWRVRQFRSSRPWLLLNDSFYCDSGGNLQEEYERRYPDLSNSVRRSDIPYSPERDLLSSDSRGSINSSAQTLGSYVPEWKSPIQQVNVWAALLLSRQLGCRLPTSQEWKIADGDLDHQVPETIRLPALRPRSWRVLARYYQSMRQEQNGARTSIIAPNNGGYEVATQRDSDPEMIPCSSYAAKKYLFPPLIGTEFTKFNDLQGGVAEWYCDVPSIYGEEFTRDSIIQFIKSNSSLIGAIGGSAISVPAKRKDLIPLSAIVDRNGTERGYADVGFRLAITCPNPPISVQIQAIIDGLRLEFPFDSKLDDAAIGD